MVISRIGKKGKRKLADKARALTLYFKRGENVCQVCGGYITRREADAMHKRKASLCKSELDGSGGEVPENLIAGHRDCHGWADRTLERRRTMERSPVNVLTGGVIEWSEEQKESLYLELRRCRTFV